MGRISEPPAEEGTLLHDRQLLDTLRDILGPDGLLDDAAARTVYARDASHLLLGRPLAVALPRDADQVAQVVVTCAGARVPVVCRGAGTGLSGGAVPPEGALVLSLARLNHLDPLDAVAATVRVGAGVLNEQVSRQARPAGLHFAPDPSSQMAATIGGNIAENAGGPHCLRHGVTLQHLHRLEWVDAAGRTWSTDQAATAGRGIDLVALLCGSEGTLGVVTAADLSLLPDPPAVATLLAVYDHLDQATGAVVRLLGAGLLPVAVEMVDRAMLVAVEAAFAFGFPTDCDAVMIAEFAGGAEEVAEDGDRARALLLEAGAREVTLAADDAERARLWMCRKKAFGAVGRLAPRYVTMDVVVPLGRLPRLIADIQTIKAAHRVDVATTFHAGDGNLHPGVHYDDRDPDATVRAHAAADAIIRRALELGGSVTGEHGVGIEKLHVLPWQIDREAARLMAGIKGRFDPEGLLNPGKVLPGPDAEWADVPPVPLEVRFAWEDLTVTVPAGSDLAAVQSEALDRGFWIPVGGVRGGECPGLGTLGRAGTLVDEVFCGPPLVGGTPVRDTVLELWAEDGTGRLFHIGAPVFKNVAGYDLTHLLVGSGGVLARPHAVTFKLAPVPQRLAIRGLVGDPAQLVSRLAPLLRERPPGSGAPTVVADADSRRLWVLVAGRHRSWDLGAWLERLEVVGPVVHRADGELSATAELLDAAQVPAWALGSADWTVHRSDAPPIFARWIRSATPLRFWIPEALAGDGADVVWRDGESTPLPSPPSDVPLALLRELKDLFDPDGVLATPRWLAPGPSAAEGEVARGDA